MRNLFWIIFIFWVNYAILEIVFIISIQIWWIKKKILKGTRNLFRIVEIFTFVSDSLTTYVIIYFYASITIKGLKILFISEGIYISNNKKICKIRLKP